MLKGTRLTNLPRRMQHNINNFYYIKLWNTFGLMVMLQAIQCMLILFTKQKEATFIKQWQSLVDNAQYAEINEIGTYHKFDVNYVFYQILDWLIVIHFCLINHFTLLWYKNSN